MNASVQYLNPEGLPKNPAYSQAVVVGGNLTTIYVGGQNAVDASGNTVGEGDIRAQTEKALLNLETALAAGGAGLENVVKWNVYIFMANRLKPDSRRFKRFGVDVRIHRPLPASLFRHWHALNIWWKSTPLP